jgi:hypothetical protein
MLAAEGDAAAKLPGLDYREPERHFDFPEDRYRRGDAGEAAADDADLWKLLGPAPWSGPKLLGPVKKQHDEIASSGLPGT